MPTQEILTRPDTDTNGETASHGRSLPANLEAEAAFIGAVLIDNRVLEELPIELAAKHFFAPVHQRIFDRVLVGIERQMIVTPVTLRPYFENDEGMKLSLIHISEPTRPY